MFHNHHLQSPIRAISLLAIFCFLVSCSPAQQLAKHYGATKKEIRTRLVRIDAEGQKGILQRSKGMYVSTSTLPKHKTDPEEFTRIESLDYEKFYGPYLEKDSTVYYLWKLGSEEVPYADFTIIQFHQRFGIGDELFQERLDSLMAQSIRSPNFAQHLEDFPDDDEIGVGMVLEMKEEALERLKPGAQEFLRSAPPIAFRLAEKAKFPNTTITEVLVKNKELVYYKHLRYAKIIIRKAL